MAQIGETELDVGALWRALWRRAWLLVILTIAAAVGTYIALGFVDPLYTADTRILIEERESPLTRPRDNTGAPSSDFDESAIQSQVEVLRSREIAEAVIDKLNLMQRPDFDPALQPSLLRSLLVMVGLGENPADSTIRQRIMESYFSRLSVYALQKSRVIGVEFSAPDPNLAAEVANAVADAFVELQQNAKRESAVAATVWLQQEIERLRGRVAEAEQAVADYRESRGLFDVDRGGDGNTDSGNLSTQQLGEINAELARARAAHAEAEARANLVETILAEGGPIDASEEVLNSQLIQRLRERQGALSAQIAELSTTLLPTHPRIRALEGQVTNLEGQIRGEASKILASLQTAARVAAAREESLIRSLDEAKGAVSRSNDEGIELRALQREAAAQRELLESFLSRYREAAARTDAGYLPADARIISRAVAPNEPSFPKKTMMSVAAAVVMLLLASAVVLLGEFMSGRAFRVIGYGVEGARAETRESAVVSDAADPTEDEVRVVVAEVTPVSPSRDEDFLDADTLYDDEPEDDEPDDEALADEDLLAEVPVEEPPSVESPAPEPVEQPLPETRSSYQAPREEHVEHVPPPRAPEPAAARTEVAPEKSSERAPAPTAEDETRSGTSGLAEILANSSVRIALFAGAEGGEGAGSIAFSAARQAAKQKVRSILVDIGREPSKALGNERPGLVDLLTGDASFGEVIQRDDAARVHMIPLGSTGNDIPMQRMQLVISALTHTYDKVVIVADKLDDWPDEQIRPDIAAIVCGPDTSDSLRTALYDFTLARGAHSAIIVRYSSDLDLGDREESAAA